MVSWKCAGHGDPAERIFRPIGTLDAERKRGIFLPAILQFNASKD
jgi:hypothetical protein